MAEICESCGETGPLIETGVFAGTPHQLDYCRWCLMDLCPTCLNKECLDSGDGRLHEAYMEDEDEED